MSGRVNIPTTIKDEHYRYKMERMICKVEGKGNGIKTVVPNIANISRDLRVPPSYPTKYFGIHFGAVSNYDARDERGIVNGKHDPKDMEAALNAFIRKFILCRKCNYPETDMVVSKQNIELHCKACGHVSTVDPTERLCKFILANPPSSTPTKSERRAMQKTQQVLDAGAELDDSADDNWAVDVSEEAVRRRHEAESSAMSSNMLGLSLQDVADDDSKKKKSSRKDDEEDDDDDDDGEISPVEVLRSFLQVKPDATEAQLMRAVKKIESDYGLSDLDCVCLMFEALFDEDILEQIPRYAAVMQPFVESTGNKGQKILLGYIEDFVGKSYKSMLTSLPLILEKFYDFDLLDEEIIVDWHGKKRSKFIKSSKALAKIKEAAKPFVQWLQTAEEDD